MPLLAIVFGLIMGSFFGLFMGLVFGSARLGAAGGIMFGAAMAAAFMIIDGIADRRTAEAEKQIEREGGAILDRIPGLMSVCREKDGRVIVVKTAAVTILFQADRFSAVDAERKSAGVITLPYGEKDMDSLKSALNIEVRNQDGIYRIVGAADDALWRINRFRQI